MVAIKPIFVPSWANPRHVNAANPNIIERYTLRKKSMNKPSELRAIGNAFRIMRFVYPSAVQPAWMRWRDFEGEAALRAVYRELIEVFSCSDLGEMTSRSVTMSKNIARSRLLTPGCEGVLQAVS
jgi:hypothetical protein